MSCFPFHGPHTSNIVEITVMSMLYELDKILTWQNKQARELLRPGQNVSYLIIRKNPRNRQRKIITLVIQQHKIPRIRKQSLKKPWNTCSNFFILKLIDLNCDWHWASNCDKICSDILGTWCIKNKMGIKTTDSWETLLMGLHMLIA